jgi:hypothetical protein
LLLRGRLGARLTETKWLILFQATVFIERTTCFLIDDFAIRLGLRCCMVLDKAFWAETLSAILLQGGDRCSGTITLA